MRVSDVAAHIAGEDAESIRWLNDGHRSEFDGTTAWVQRNRSSWATGGPVRSFAVCDHDSGELLGTAEANLDWSRLGHHEGEVNLSYQVYPPARGRGVAGRAVAVVLDYLLGVPEAHRALVMVDLDNRASIRVAEKSGFKLVGEKACGDGVTRRCYTLDLTLRRAETGPHALMDR